MKADQERVRGLLTDTLSLICKSSLAYNEELRIEGVIGVTVDNSDVFIVHVNDAFGKDGLRKPHIIISGAESAQGNDVGDGIVSQNQPDGSISRRGRKRKTRLACQGNVPPTATSEEQLAPVVVAETLSPGGESSAASVCRDKGLPGDLNDTTVTDHCASEERPAKRQNADNGDTSHDVLGSLVSAANLDGDNSYTINIMPNASTVADAWNTTANDSCSAENTAEHGSEQIVKLEQVSGDNIAYLDDSDNDTVDMSRDYGDASANLSSVLHKQSRRKTAASTLLNASSDAAHRSSAYDLQQAPTTTTPAYNMQQMQQDSAYNMQEVQHDSAYNLRDVQGESVYNLQVLQGESGFALPQAQTEYEVLEGATQRGQKKLYDSCGYSYVVSKTRERATYWRCSNKHVKCSANITERNGVFKRNNECHSHPPNLGEKARDQLRSAAMLRVKDDIHTLPDVIAKQLCSEYNVEQGVEGMRVDNLKKLIKRGQLRLEHTSGAIQM